MAEPRTYSGSCHCGQVRYEATLSLAQVAACNCSICQKRGALWAFVPASGFKMLAGESALTDYQFGKKTIHHLFCPTCGVGSFSRGRGPDGSEMIAINARCLESVDLTALEIVPFDGRSL